MMIETSDNNSVLLLHNYDKLLVNGSSKSTHLPPSPASTPVMLYPKKPKMSRRVSFGLTETLAYIETASELTEYDKDRRWFQADELEEIKVSARKLCVQESKGFGISSNESTRGMDVYYPSRQRNHKKFVEHVLEAYHFRFAGNVEHVGRLVERWSAKSKRQATERAEKDFYEAYSPHVLLASHQIAPDLNCKVLHVLPLELERTC